MQNQILSTIAAIILVMASVGAAHAAGCDAPAPQLQPTTVYGVPAAAAGFGGTWQGSWPIVARQHVYPRCAKLYVKVTGAQTATVEQCSGSLREPRMKPECKQYAAQIIGNEMTFTDFDGTIFSFTLADVGGMLAKRVNAEHRSVTNFTKAQ